jgi:hypothetical protein
MARLRASHSATFSGAEIAAVFEAASALGRRLVEITAADGPRAFVLGWSDGNEPAIGQEGISVRHLSAIPILTFACCLRLCWPDPASDPYPGERTRVADVIRLATSIGADDRHVKGALRSELRAAGLVQLHVTELSLGPAVAAWAPAQVEALRRYHTTLPAPEATYG